MPQGINNIMNLRQIILEAIEDEERKKLIDAAINAPIKNGLKLDVLLKRNFPNVTFTPEEKDEIRIERTKKANKINQRNYRKDPVKGPKIKERENIRARNYRKDPIKGRKIKERDKIRQRNDRKDPIKGPKIKERENIRARNNRKDPIKGPIIRAKENARRKARRASEPELALKKVLRNRFNRFVKSKGKLSFSKYVDISYPDLVKRLESLFRDGMSWENRGKWHIDHIRPLASFQYYNDDGSINEQNIRDSWAITNMQPLWDYENLSKGAKWDPEGKAHFEVEPKDFPSAIDDDVLIEDDNK